MCLNRSDDSEHCRMHGIVSETFDRAYFLLLMLDILVDTSADRPTDFSTWTFELFYKYRRSIQLTALL